MCSQIRRLAISEASFPLSATIVACPCCAGYSPFRLALCLPMSPLPQNLLVLARARPSRAMP
jgi:hypothetical protein